ncbi:MAG: Endonuclease MutS2 [Calditrichaeota bacterium]|nr:Endonuclease MutS2 [Calditrichota bacterium]
MPASERKEEKRRAALAELEYERVLAAIGEQCATDYGRARITAMFPPFAPDPAWVKRAGREDTLADEFDRLEALTGLIERGEQLPFGGVRDLGDSLARARVEGSRLEPHELLDIAHLLAACDRLRAYLEKHAGELAPLAPFLELLPSAPDLVDRIERAIDPRSGNVSDDASPGLRRLRRAVEGAQQKMRSRLDTLVSRYGDAGVLLESGFSVREDRYVLAVKAGAKGRVRGIVHGYSASGGTVYVEPDELVAIGNEIREREEEVAEEVRRVLRELTGAVRDHLEPLHDAVLACGLLDSLQARARFAERVGALRPAVAEGAFRLVDARHPLLLLRKGIEGTVPLSLALGRDADTTPQTPDSGPRTPDSRLRAFVITGPNAGGKTVALKTVGVVTAMIHAGIWPPAGDGTVVPPIDEWHVLIGDEQSLEGDLSSFTGHLERLKAIALSPAPDKLVLVDEITAGTDPGEGGPLAMAFLELAVQRGWWTLVTTHMGELKAFAHRTAGVRNGSMQFDRDTLSPTYVFQPDLPGSSYALEIASRVGLPKKVVTRARELAGKKRQRLEDLIEELSSRLRAARDRERELADALARAEQHERTLKQRLERIEAKRDEAVEQATAEAKRLLADANRTIELTVKQIREQQASKQAIREAKERVEQQRRRIEEEERSAKQRAESRRRRERESSPAPPKPAADGEDLTGPVRVGDEVVAGESGVRGEVLAVKKESAQVAAGSVKLWLPLSELRRVGRAKPSGRAAVEVADGGERGRPSTELNLIGKRAADAASELEAYLEAIALAGLPYARIVHGKGTGTLRAIVQERLANHPDIESFRFGEPGEGGDGVTIVTVRG